ncbi:MAG: hypothetical protein M3R04_10840 [bacterium]|nr:hypothetical protein [bacterium]
MSKRLGEQDKAIPRRLGYWQNITRLGAMLVLGAIDPAALDAVPMLSQLAGQPETCDMAQWALKEIIKAKTPGDR